MLALCLGLCYIGFERASLTVSPRASLWQGIKLICLENSVIRTYWADFCQGSKKIFREEKWSDAHGFGV